MNIEFNESFNWLAVLKDLTAGMPITEQDFRTLRHMAGQWPTCACGQLCKALPREDLGRPYDMKLKQFGSEFYHFIELRAWGFAMMTFHKIEARTDKLLANQEVQQNK